MIADSVIGIDIALAAHGVQRQLRLHFVDENAVTHGLGGIDLACRAGKAGLQIADAAEDIAVLLYSSRRGPCSLRGGVTIQDVDGGHDDSPVTGLSTP